MKDVKEIIVKEKNQKKAHYTLQNIALCTLPKILLKTLLAIPFIILISSNIVHAQTSTNHCEYKLIENEIIYSCTVPFSVQIGEPQFITLKNTQLYGVARENITLLFDIYNNQDTTQNIEYYAYAYTGSQCVSCRHARNETMKEITLAGKTQAKQEILIQIPQAGNFSYKVVARIDNNPWREQRGTIYVKSRSIEYNPIQKNKTKANFLLYAIITAIITVSSIVIYKQWKSTHF